MPEYLPIVYNGRIWSLIFALKRNRFYFYVFRVLLQCSLIQSRCHQMLVMAHTGSQKREPFVARSMHTEHISSRSRTYANVSINSIVAAHSGCFCSLTGAWCRLSLLRIFNVVSTSPIGSLEVLSLLCGPSFLHDHGKSGYSRYYLLVESCVLKWPSWQGSHQTIRFQLEATLSCHLCYESPIPPLLVPTFPLVGHQESLHSSPS